MLGSRKGATSAAAQASFIWTSKSWLSCHIFYLACPMFSPCCSWQGKIHKMPPCESHSNELLLLFQLLCEPGCPHVCCL